MTICDSSSSRSLRCGSVLIEVLVALVLFAIAGTAMITMLGQTAQTMRSTLASERETRGATRELAMLSLSRSADLAAVGEIHRQHGWIVYVNTLAPNLFDVGIAASETTAVLLRTTMYLPDSVDAR